MSLEKVIRRKKQFLWSLLSVPVRRLITKSNKFNVHESLGSFNVEKGKGLFIPVTCSHSERYVSLQITLVLSPMGNY